MPARKKTFSRAPSQRRSHFTIEFIFQVQIIDFELNKLDSKRISLERSYVVGIIFSSNQVTITMGSGNIRYCEKCVKIKDEMMGKPFIID